MLEQNSLLEQMCFKSLNFFGRTVLFAIVPKNKMNSICRNPLHCVALLLLFLSNTLWRFVVCTTKYSFWKQQSSHNPRICVVDLYCLFVYMRIIVTVRFVFQYWECCVFFLKNHTWTKKFGLSQKKFFAFSLHAWSLISGNARSKLLFVLVPPFMRPSV